MDDSLSEFQEKKKGNAGPKNSDITTGTKPNPKSLSEFQKKKKGNAGPTNSDKPTEIKPNPKKRVKREKGQKDIRTALKSKKNELVSYANDFEKICKLSGIDVDPEQLQVAIALSKSLQQTENKSEDDSQSSGSLSSQDRTGKIRTTLQEYGFKVPEIKITASKGRKLKFKKFYKLLLLTTAEKQQITSDRYSQVLFQNLDNSKFKNTVNQIDIPNVHLYNIATHIIYKHLKSNNIFYVEELIDKSPGAVGCLLRDWTDIPGRPASPICDRSDINFEDIECSQDELDTILSGSLKCAQEIAINKHNLLVIQEVSSKDTNISKDVQLGSHIDTNMEVTPVKIDIMSNQGTQVASTFRSFSPDLFDDEVSSIMDKSNRDTDVISQVSSKSTVKDINDFMDLTECVNVKYQRVLSLENTTINEKPLSQLSQGSNTTKRRSNDFMEITECIAGISQPINTKDKIDLTHFDGGEVLSVAEINRSIQIETMDLTQSSDSDDSLPFVQINGPSKSLDDTIILNDEDNDVESKLLEETIIVNNDVYDVINERNTLVAEKNKEPISNDLKAIESSDPKKKIFDVSIKETVNTKQNALNNEPTNSIDTEISEPTLLNNTNSNLNSDSENKQYISTEIHKSKSNGSLEDFGHHSDDHYEDEENVVTLGHTINTFKSDVSNGSDDKNVDLTQNSEQEAVDCDTSPQISYDTSSLGKDGDISIDYDEIFDHVVESTSSSKYSNIADNKINTLSAQSNKSNSDLPSSSQESEVFEISDKELDYSLNKSKHEIVHNNFDLGEISIMDNMYNARNSKSSNFEYCKTFNDFTNDSVLPMVDLKGSKDDYVGKKYEFALPTRLFNIEASTPFKKDANEVKTHSETPSSSEYIIKINQVTPISDYKSMTTPERNKELDKYGLKPFKRKRAIQLLTHIYNQTHPIVTSCSIEDPPSSSKRIKTDNNSEQLCLTPKKLTKSPKKISKKPKSSRKVSAENNMAIIKSPKRTAQDVDRPIDLYDITTEVPDIRDTECSEEDWVFQKREKAKVHSCRVPLHIAWQNYLGARRGLRAAILRYEPINIDVIHRGLVAAGHRFQPKDLLKFMDKKCITVKTADSCSRNNKKH